MNTRLTVLSSALTLLFSSSVFACGGGGYSAPVVHQIQPAYQSHHVQYARPVYQSHHQPSYASPAYPPSLSTLHRTGSVTRTSVPAHVSTPQVSQPRPATSAPRVESPVPPAPQPDLAPTAASGTTESVTKPSTKSLTSEETVALLKLFTAKEVKDALQ